MIDEDQTALLWVTDFPMFEWNAEEERLEALHHPFTAPNPAHMNVRRRRSASWAALDPLLDPCSWCILSFSHNLLLSFQIEYTSSDGWFEYGDGPFEVCIDSEEIRQFILFCV